MLCLHLSALHLSPLRDIEYGSHQEICTIHGNDIMSQWFTEAMKTHALRTAARRDVSFCESVLTGSGGSLGRHNQPFFYSSIARSDSFGRTKTGEEPIRRAGNRQNMTK